MDIMVKSALSSSIDVQFLLIFSYYYEKEKGITDEQTRLDE